MQEMNNYVAFVDLSKCKNLEDLYNLSHKHLNLFIDFITMQEREDIDFAENDGLEGWLDHPLYFRFKATEEVFKGLRGNIFDHYGLCSKFWYYYGLTELRFEKDYRGLNDK